MAEQQKPHTTKMETIEEHSRDEASGTSSPTAKKMRLVLVGAAQQDLAEWDLQYIFGVPVLKSETGEEYIDSDAEWCSLFVLSSFENQVYDNLHKFKQCIWGVPALLYNAQLKFGISPALRPVYNYAMKGVVTCFTGIRRKDELTRLVNLIHAMGGCIRKDMNSKITHLICTHSGGEKYQYAKTFRLSVVRPEWVYAAWEKRCLEGFSATNEEFSKQHSVKCFEGLKICFVGFPKEEHQHMVEVLISNGGQPAELDDVEATHVVVDKDAIAAKPEPKNPRTHVLKVDWFWYTIQNGYADELDYLFVDYLESMTNTPSNERRDSLPISFNKRKRKRFSQRLQLEGSPLGSGKRRSSVSDAGLLSVSGSFFDCTTSPDKLLANDGNVTPASGKLLDIDNAVCEQTPGKKTMRYNYFTDFFNTESNYVGILDTIVNLFKNPLEDLAETNDVLLNKSEIRAIFGNFLPIHEVHKSMLEDLQNINAQWKEDCSIGYIILKHRDDLIKAYPPYVNFFEQMKETLQQSDKENPRFHAFLKLNQTKPECGRQSLADLMIRPVQRLPSISLLLNDILKHTNKTNPDYACLEEALKAIKEVMTYINEDRRRTESRVAIFDIFNDIEGCPAHLVSSNRSFISKCEVIELSDSLSGRGDTLMLYLFSDTVEVCKKRSRAFNASKSPSTGKNYKHIKLLSLNNIRFVVNLTDDTRAFALLLRTDKEKLYSFLLADEEGDKTQYMKALCKQMAENACFADTDKFILLRSSQDLDVDISDINLSTLSKAFKLAARTRLKVGRAFSFNKTPLKLKRAVSTMMTSPFGSTNSLTPATQLAQMRLASCTNIHEASNEDESRSNSPTTQSEVLMPPLSVQPTRKNKSSTLNGVGRI